MCYMLALAVKNSNTIEHRVNSFFPAYYLDYQERRQNYVNAFFAELVNWDFAESNFIAATANDTGETEEL
jgi:superoxide dismutase